MMEVLTENASKTYTIAEYLAMEERATEKSEYYNGEIIAMPGGKYNHNLIASNILTALNIALDAKGSSLDVLNSDMKIFIPHLSVIVYPDAVVVCEGPEFSEGRTDIILNPLLVVEVLSRSTQNFDRTTKFFWYKQIPSFQEYVLVEQKMPYLTASYKIAERTWQDTEAEGLNSTIYLKSVDCTLDLKKIYKGVSFETV